MFFKEMMPVYGSPNMTNTGKKAAPDSEGKYDANMVMWDVFGHTISGAEV